MPHSRRTAIIAALTFCIGAADLRAQTATPAAKAPMLRIEAPWLRATPGGAKVAGGYLRVTNVGSEPERLGGARVPFATRVEVHEMSMQDGVMKMRPLAGGLDLPPGATVELKPGGYHLMFMDLKGGLKEGDSVPATLSFEKAGEVPVTFQVGGLGGGPPQPH